MPRAVAWGLQERRRDGAAGKFQRVPASERGTRAMEEAQDGRQEVVCLRGSQRGRPHLVRRTPESSVPHHRKSGSTSKEKGLLGTYLGVDVRLS